MSYMLPHLRSGYAVDQAILAEDDRVVVIRFGHDHDATCMLMDEALYSISERVKNFGVVYLVDITEVPDFNTMYELYDPCTVMFFFRVSPLLFCTVCLLSVFAPTAPSSRVRAVFTTRPLPSHTRFLLFAEQTHHDRSWDR